MSEQLDQLECKLHPGRLPRMPLFTAAVVGYVLGRAFTQPQIEELVVDETENLVYVRKTGAADLEAVQSLEDFRGHWNRLLDGADLTPQERSWVMQQFRSKVRTASRGNDTQLA